MFLNKFFLTTALALVLTAPAMAAKKDIPTIKPACWEENKADHVERHCAVPGVPELKPEARQPVQPRPQPQVQAPLQVQQPAPSPPPPPAVVAAPPPPPVNAPGGEIRIHIGPEGVTVPGLFHVGPEGFNILGFIVTNPNYHPPIAAPAYAPVGPGQRR
jgi:hypothetical protein